MAIVTDPSILIKITGTNISTYEENSTFPLDGKNEISVNIQSTSTAYTVPLAVVKNTKLIYFYSTGDFTLTFTTTVGAFPIPVSKRFVLETSQAFITSLISLTISTTSSNLIPVNIGIYGEEVSS